MCGLGEEGAESPTEGYDAIHSESQQVSHVETQALATVNEIARQGAARLVQG